LQREQTRHAGRAPDPQRHRPQLRDRGADPGGQRARHLRGEKEFEEDHRAAHAEQPHRLLRPRQGSRLPVRPDPPFPQLRGRTDHLLLEEEEAGPRYQRCERRPNRLFLKRARRDSRTRFAKNIFRFHLKQSISIRNDARK
jgi:hypothetical protein